MEELIITIFSIIIGSGIFAAAILYHELGHILYFKMVLKKKVGFKWIRTSKFKGYFQVGTQEDYNNLTDKQYTDILQWGIVAGFVPILISAFIHWWFLALVVPYLIGSRSDILELNNYKRDEDSEDEDILDSL